MRESTRGGLRPIVVVACRLTVGAEKSKVRSGRRERAGAAKINTFVATGSWPGRKDGVVRGRGGNCETGEAKGQRRYMTGY